MVQQSFCYHNGCIMIDHKDRLWLRKTFHKGSDPLTQALATNTDHKGEDRF